MKGKKIILLAVLIGIAAVIAVGLKEAGNGKKVVAVGLYSPDFSVVNTATGKAVSSADLKGKVLFVHFWASWCKVCNDEMPTVNSLAADMTANSDFRMITILYRDSPEKGAAYMADKGFQFPVFTDPDENAAKTFGVTGVPETYIIDRKGVLRGKVIGETDWNSPEARQLITSLLKS